ncbi:MAG TPA: hypothetical protein VM536_21550, partial [Chloroflexia bacterium]|nr:hypothetical protein [Chloroflexia bacterium]
LDYELPEGQRAVVREHLRRCPQCENELATLRATKQLLRDLPAVPTPRSFKLSVEQVAAYNPQAARPASRWRLPRLAFAFRLSATAALLLLLMTVSADLFGLGGQPATLLTAATAPQMAASESARSSAPAAAPAPTGVTAAYAADTAQPTTAAAAVAAPPVAPAPGGAAPMLPVPTTVASGLHLAEATPANAANAAGNVSGAAAITNTQSGLADQRTLKSADATPEVGLATGAAAGPAAGSSAPPLGLIADQPVANAGPRLALWPWELLLAGLTVALAAAGILLPRRSR